MKSGYKHLRCGLIGEKLGHSFSKPIHQKLADYSFVIREVEREKLGEFLKSDELDAFCVTIPYKKDVIPYLDYISPEAEAIGAVNVIVRHKGNNLYGYNTDYFGFEYMLDTAGVSVTGKNAVVFGNGGASLTICTVLRHRGVGKLTVIGTKENTPENMAALADTELIINATPVGMYPNNGKAPTSLDYFPKCQAVLDVIYNPPRTALMLDAQQKGIPSASGLSMLVAQAAKGFEHFTGDKYEEGCIEKITAEISRDTMNIILVGMPGCGKSTVGKLLAASLDRQFCDGDEEFAKMHGITPAEAISTLGEEKFRLLEHKVLQDLGKRSSLVIATGGGAVTREYNYAPLHQNGVIIYLERDLDKLPTEGRPLSQKGSLAQLFAERESSYLRFADITVRSREVPEETANAMLKALDGYDYTCVLKK